MAMLGLDHSGLRDYHPKSKSFILEGNDDEKVHIFLNTLHKCKSTVHSYKR